MEKHPYVEYSAKERKEMENFSKSYKEFIGQVKDVVSAVDYFIEELKKNGAKELDKVKKLEKGDIVYKVHHGRTVAVAKIGQLPFNFVVAHIDSPRLDMKMKFLKEKNGLAILDTQYYGGIKPHQWFTIPLELTGKVITKSGKEIKISGIYTTITELAPHVDRKQDGKAVKDAFAGERLDAILATFPTEDKKKKDDGDKEPAILKTVYSYFKKMGIEKEDLYAADLSLVPAFGAFELGVDKSLIGAYGHDDRICCYTGFKAAIDSRSKRTVIAYLVDREEIGSTGIVGMRSAFFRMFIYELMEKMGVEPTEYNYLKLANESFAVSADVTVAYDPVFPEPTDPEGGFKIGWGVCVERFLGGFGKMMSVELPVAKFRSVLSALDKGKVRYQVGDFAKVDEGGGGTEAMILADDNIPVLDMGPALWSMHSPFEVVSKVDLWETYKAYKVLCEAEI